jgi:glycosidase
MKNRFALPVAAAFLAAAACSPDPAGWNPGDGDETVGLMTPVLLQAGQTAIYTGDYFLEPNEVDSVVWPAGLTATYKEDSAVYRVTGALEKAVDVAHFWMDGASFDLVLFANGAQWHTFTYPRESGDSAWEAGAVHVIGTFNSWNRTANALERGDSLWTLRLPLFPGNHEYKFVVNGVEMLDPANSRAVPNGIGGYNNTLTISRPGKRAKQIHTKTVNESGTVLTLSAVPKDQNVWVLWENHLLPEASVVRTPSGVRIHLPEEAEDLDRSFVRVYTANQYRRSNDLLIPLEKGRVLLQGDLLHRHDWEAATLYFLMVDRFANGDPSNDKPLRRSDVLPQADFHGGDLDGVTWAIQKGFFEDLGFNTVWLSPIARNPQGAWGLWNKTAPTTKFSAYHGYWPASNTQPDARFARPEQVQNTLASAHNRNLNVLLDYVGNHVHQEHPVYRARPEWFNSLYLPDSTLNTEKWDEYRLTTWFDTFLPDVNTENPEAVAALTDSALVWVRDYGFDGYRHDATKHVANLYWRTLTQKLKHQVAAPRNQRLYQIGETYGSPELIASYLGSGLMDAQFDFNLYDAALGFCANLNTDAPRLKEVLDASLTAYGHHHLMGNISGNQDKPRFISLASGDVRLDEDTKAAGYTRKIGTPAASAYQKLAMMHAFNFTVPGIPVVYYGDEYGMPGANDPDNRRPMKFKNYTPEEDALRKEVAKLARFRQKSPVLAYGSTTTKALSNNVLLIERSYFGERAITVLNRSKQPLTFTVKQLRLHPKTRLVAGKAQIGTETMTVPAGTFATLFIPR